MNIYYFILLECIMSLGKSDRITGLIISIKFAPCAIVGGGSWISPPPDRNLS